MILPGGVGNGGIVHFAANLYGLGPGSHLRFMLYDYYLNGNLRTWEVARYYSDAYAATAYRHRTYAHRATGGSLRLFAEAYQAWWDPEHLRCASHFAEILYEAQQELGVTRFDDVYMNEGKVLYYQLTGDQRMRDLFLNDMEHNRRTYGAHVFNDTRHTSMYGLSHAYWFTGDEQFLPFALWQLDVARRMVVTEGDPRQIGAVGWTLEFAYNATLGNQLPVIMAAIVDARADLARRGTSLPDAEGPSPEQ